MTDPNIVPCAHCASTGKCKCSACIETLNNKLQSNIRENSEVGCCYCEGIGTRSPWNENSLKMTLNTPSLTVTYAQQEGETKRRELNNRSLIAAIGILAGLGVITIAIFAANNNAVLINIGGNAITFSVGSFFGFQSKPNSKPKEEN